jgi:ligand-binding sensor domain-containing protein/signal transduction histidine kinase
MGHALSALWLGLAITVWAEQLPIKTYTAADGLAHNSVHRIVRDGRGYLWFCTSEGLSRFDGYEFHNYGKRDGLPHRDVRDWIEARSGDFWVATGGGLCRLRPRPGQGGKFQVYRVPGNQRASYINSVLEDSQGRIWCGTDGGLFRLEPGKNDSAMRPVDLGMPNESFSQLIASALLEDSRAGIWVGAGSGLYRLSRDGRTERYTTENGLPDNSVTTLLEDREKRIWAGTGRGLCKLSADPTPERRIVERVYREADGLGADYIRGLHQLRDGTLCAGTAQGLSVLRTGAAEEKTFRTYTTSHGLPGMVVDGLAEDSAGNLWIGLDDGGAAKITWQTFLTYTRSDGLLGTQVDSIFETRNGALGVLSRRSSELFLNEFDGARFHALKLSLPPGTRLLDWGARNQSVAQDREGNWWVGTGDGLLRFSGGSRAQPVSTGPPSLYGESVFSVFQDAAGNLWLSTTGSKNGLARFDHQSHVLQHFGEADGLPPLNFGGVSLFAQDKGGDLWMGRFRFRQGEPGLVRYRAGRFQPFTAGQDAPGGGIRALHLDRKGRLWVGTTQNGVLRSDNPGTESPRFTGYTMTNGLSSDIVLSLTEDSRGRICIGTGGGVDRLDPDTGQIKRFTSADGLAPGEVHAAFCDRSGALWFGAGSGLSRLPVESDRPQTAAPPIFITALRVAGVGQPIAETGETDLSGLRFQPGQDHIQFEFVGLDFAPGERPRYQYRLEGADGDWSAPAELRSVNYAHLAPGAYRFVVRAVDSAGVTSSHPASVAFTLLPPMWVRWWFRLPLAAALAAICYALYRYRIAHLLELEQVRIRIATDLHDDIGSSLAQIAILSEVASRKAGDESADRIAPLSDIAAISRELADSMSDIVWAVDPELDRLAELVQRMRRFASDVVSADGIRLQFRAPAAELDVPMGADLRRQLFLIFKESLHNAVRHSGATEIEVELGVKGGWLQLEIRDNGRGFDTASASVGHGVKSIRDRAASLGGQAEIVSEPGKGTSVALRLRLTKRASRLPK